MIKAIRKIAVLEMIAAVVMMVVMCFFVIRTWVQIDELFDSMEQSSDSYLSVVEDGKDIFQESYATLDTHINTIRDVREHLESLVDECVDASLSLDKFKFKMFGKEFLKLETLHEIVEYPIKPLMEIDRSLFEIEEVLKGIKTKETGDKISQAFDHTTESLNKAKSAMGGINSSLHGVLAAALIIMFIGCLSMFCHGLRHLRSPDESSDGRPSQSDLCGSDAAE